MMLSTIFYNFITSEIVGPTTNLNFTCTGMKGLEWNCSFWDFFRRNIIGEIFLISFLRPHYVIYFIGVNILTIFGINKILQDSREK